MSFDLSTARPVEGMVAIQPDSDTSSPPTQPALERAVYGTLGAGVGTAAGAYQVKEPFLRARMQRIEEQEMRREAGRIKAQQAARAAQAAAEVAPSVAATPPSPLEVVRNIPESSGAANWGRKMAKDLPYAVAESAESMRKSDPTGAQALIDKDIAAKQKLRNIGEPPERYPLTQAGPGQLAVPAEELARLNAEQAAKAAAEQAAREAAEQAALKAAQPPKLSGLEQITQMYRDMMRRIPAPVKFAGPIAGGVGAGLDIATLKEQMALPSEERDPASMVGAGMGLAGGAMSLTAAGLIPGLALSLSAPAVEYIMRRARESGKTPGERYAYPAP